MPHILHQYEYKPKWMIIFLAGLFSGVMTALFAYWGLTNQQGLVLGDIIHLPPLAATIFYWCLSVLFFLGMLVTILLACVRLTSPQRIAVTDTGIILPIGRWFSHEEVHIKFVDVQAVKKLEYKSNVFLYIYANGLRYTILKDFLLGRGDFEEIENLLAVQATKNERLAAEQNR